MSSLQPKPWSVSQFEEYRPEMVSWVKENVIPLIKCSFRDGQLKHCLIQAQVKVGKREIVEYLSMRDFGNLRIKHVFISAWHRRADENQRDELKDHGIHVFSVSNTKNYKECMEYIEVIKEDISSSPDNKCIIHWDECDYGTGDKQNLSKIFNDLKDLDQIFHIYYSATPHEAIVSEIFNDSNSMLDTFYTTGKILSYEPPVGYCGAEAFLNENLVKNAEEFFKIDHNAKLSLTEQGKNIINQCNKDMKKSKREKTKLQQKIYDLEDEIEKLEDEIEISDRNIQISQIQKNLEKNKFIIVLRLTYNLGKSKGSKKDNKAFWQFLQKISSCPDLEDINIIVDKADLSGGLPEDLRRNENFLCQQVQWSNRQFFESMNQEKITIIVHDQTSSRSTEWVFHDMIHTTHDYRKQKICYNTVTQAQQRVNHYRQNYDNEMQKIYVFGHLDSWLFSAEKITLLEYCMNNKLSTRISGKVKQVNDFKSYFVPINEPKDIKNVKRDIKENIENIQDLSLEIHEKLKKHKISSSELFEHKNSDDKYMGYLRGYKYLKYDEVKNQYWGLNEKTKIRLTVCYHEDQLGLCLRVCTNEFIEISDLKAYKSMYC